MTFSFENKHICFPSYTWFLNISKAKQHNLCLKKIHQDIFIDLRNIKPNQKLSQLEKLIITKLWYQCEWQHFPACLECHIQGCSLLSSPSPAPVPLCSHPLSPNRLLTSVLLYIPYSFIRDLPFILNEQLFKKACDRWIVIIQRLSKDFRNLNCGMLTASKCSGPHHAPERDLSCSIYMAYPRLQKKAENWT